MTHAHLSARVLDALLREDYGGISRRVRRTRRGVVLDLPDGDEVPLESSGFVQDFVVRRPAGVSLDQTLETLRAIAHPADRPGVDAFAQECRETLATVQLHESNRDSIIAGLTRTTGVASLTYYDTLAAYLDHPVYPTSRCRLGLSEEATRRYAPEFHPQFDLCWMPVERRIAVLSGDLPAWWPQASDEDTILFPAHPLMHDHGHGCGYLRVTPTLSMRTVAVVGDPATHVKLPLPTSTLGLRNRRSIKPDTLQDGARAQRLISKVLDKEPDFRDRILLADEQTYGHAYDEHRAWLIRKFPDISGDARVVSVAALLACSPDGTLVIEQLADGDVPAFLHDYLDLLLRWNVRLFVRYGIALEAHQQNLALILNDGPLRLLLKDNDGLLTTSPAGFTDPRMMTDDLHALADVFVTITLHLAAAAIVFGAAERGLLSLRTGLTLLRTRLAAAIEGEQDGTAARLLRARTLDAARLVGKSMVTAGILVDKGRTGARDINKFYGTSGPNYLRRRPA